MLTNDLSHITLGNTKFQYRSVAPFNFYNRDIFRLIYKCLCNLSNQIFHGPTSSVIQWKFGTVLK
jgi:hypothetical protein